MKGLPTHQWPPLIVKQQIDEYQGLISTIRTSVSDSMPPRVEAYLVRYAVVRSAGLLESVRDDLAREYSRTIAPERVFNRIKKSLTSSLGCTPKQLQDFVRTFDSIWADELAKLFQADDSRHSNNVGSLVETRKKIAHGKSSQVSTSQILRWSDSVIQITKWMVNRFDPNN
ncbi:MAE_28990/MAE_18760 family HEPN-like nuclease [Corynebacterium sp. H128]|uniref:MAE_28990/MAE_18760 family HEPN-like nuclease n=1 Tax=unclassified Corynebacterium TaxID=2624378 RepID=UPI0030B3BE88